MAAVSCCDWFSTTCFAQWALGASWACTPSTFLKRKLGGGGSGFYTNTTDMEVKNIKYSSVV